MIAFTGACLGRLILGMRYCSRLSRNGKVKEKLTVAAFNVTKLALMRPDGHPGPYMYPNPFANGIKEKIHNDCLHWCMFGPIDTWNAILLEIIKKWEGEREVNSGSIRCDEAGIDAA
ncbi:Protein ALTERED XYLOGLUCAN 4 [Carex littledalei]|uniref:Protein ALTERED XYLOGLUCAN 4 n=1 Tax=Carex littledalei TaxID=544730 RepID=A0A833R474_9POAL|nr:Protein ALTERED XYLOGLUCAN 4 [Carex littledalei]